MSNPLSKGLLVAVIVLSGFGSPFAHAETIVDGDLKVGHFSFTLEDLSIPMAGMPIRVTRTYDTRQRGEALDFGHGWRVGYQDVRLEESRIPGAHWTLNSYQYGFFNLFTNYCVEPLGPPLVTITLPDDSIYRYKGAVGFTDPQVNPQTGTFAIRAIVPNPDRELLPGQYTRVRMPLEVREGALLIPEECIVIEQGGVYVYVVLPNNSSSVRRLSVPAALAMIFLPVGVYGHRRNS